VELDKQVEKVLKARGLYRTHEAYRALYRDSDAARLARLRLHAHDGIAIQSAWEEVLRTVPEKEPERPVRPAAEKLHWFLGFLEGRARLQLPPWWRKSILDASAYRRDNVYFPLEDQPFYHESGLDQVTAPVDTTLKRENGRIELRVDKEVITLPKPVQSLLAESLHCSVSARFVPNRCYLAIHGSTGRPYWLVCLDRASAKELWRTNVAANWWGSTTGPHEQRVAVTEQGGRVVVFGVATTGAHAEAFRADDGKNLFRFASTH
jgi:hypothetical protein